MPGESGPIQKLFETLDTKLKELSRRLKRVEDTARPNLVYTRIPYANLYGHLKDEAGFIYDENTNTLTVENIAAQSWQTPTLLNSWVNFGSGFNNAGYYKDPFGIVHLRGLIKSGTIGNAAFNLPSGYRPTGQCIFGTASNGTFGAVNVETGGNVIPAVGSNVWISLDGITFRVA